MKRILSAFIIAVAIHGLLLGVDFGWFKGIAPVKSEPNALTVTLALRPPEALITKALLKKPAVHPKRPPALKKAKQNAEHTATTTSQPQFGPPVQSTTASPQPDDSPYPSVGSVAKEAETPAAATDRSNPAWPPLHSIREARPLYRTNPPPKYPGIARKRRYQGNVVLAVLVKPDGRVGDLQVISSSGHSVLDRAAVAAVKYWMFEPGMIGAEKVEMWVKVPIRFELK